MTSPHCIGVIHARGGSRRVPLKNIRPLAGRPLIAWCIEAALGARTLDRVVVSTDHDGTAAEARRLGAEVPFRRPAELAEDVPSERVTAHAVHFHETETGRAVDFAVTIQPTTPFLRAADIDGCVALLSEYSDLDSALTVGPVHERPEWMYRPCENGALEPYAGGVIRGDRGVSQTLPKLVHPNGGAYVTRRRTLLDEGLLIGHRPGGWVMSRLRSVDIDEPVDFLLAEAAAAHLAEHPDD